MLKRFFVSLFLIVFIKAYVVWYSFELHRQFKWVPTTEVDKKYTGCNLKTTKLLDCALIGVCAVIRKYGKSECFYTKYIALDKVLFEPKSTDNFLISP